MFVRKLLAGALAASLVGVARAKVTISEQGKEPSIARASACYLVAYEDLDQHQVACVSSRRVGSDLVVWDPVPTIVGSRPHEVDVGSNGDDFLVVWNTMSEPEEEGVGITCAFVRSATGQAEAPIPVASSVPTVRLAIAGNEDQFLVVWEDHRSGGGQVYGARVTSGGAVLDPGGFHVATPGYRPRVASDGNRFMVVCDENNGVPSKPHGVFVEANGAVGDVFMMDDVYGTDPDVEYGDGSYLVAWSRLATSWDVYGRIYEAGGPPAGPAFPIETAPWGDFEPRVSFCNSSFLVAWRTFLASDEVQADIFARRVSPAGVLVGPKESFSAGPEDQSSLDAAADGERYAAVWDESGNPPGVFSDTVSSWQRHFYTLDDRATAFNQGRSLALDPVTGYLHLVYRGENGGVFYSYSTDNGSNWYPAECVGQGWFPCVVCENQGPNPVWVCYQTSIEGIECKARLEMGQWESFVVHSSEPLDAGAPSMALRYCGLPSEGPAVYVGYAVLDEASHTAVHCKAVSLFGGVGPLEIVESPTVGRYVHRPTLASTPGDIVHCAWEMLDPDEGVYRIQYKQRSTVGQWPQAAEDVSPWPVLPTEPASYPSVDAFGDRVYAVWRGMDLSVPPVSEAWRKERPLIGPPYDWTNPRNLSQSPGSESDYPQVSTPYAALLQEWRLFPTSNWDVWININGVPEHFFVSSDQSQYPDVAVVPPDPLHNYTDVHGVWTEGPLPGQNPPSYEVMYQMRRYSDLDRGEEFTYYDCEVGDSSRARYCLSRDGCVRWRNYRVDFGRSGLRYRLPHLNPNCIYKVITVLYQAGRDTWRQRFSLDGQPAGEVAYCPLVPETLWVTLPRELYRDDCAVELDIARLAGDYAVVAALKVYQFYPFREREGDMGNGQARRRTADPAHGFTLAEPAPNPSGRNLSVAYSVPTAGAVALRVYDAQGRLVTTLTSGPHSAGEHRARWDGRNAHGLRVATGTYFVRLESQSACLTRKAVLTR